MSLSRALFTAAALSFTALAGLVHAGEITVVGEGRVAAVPDIATLSLGVTTEAETARAALDANSQQIAAVLDRLGEAGIDPRDLQTSGLSLNPNWRNDTPGERPTIAGYTASNMVTVRIRALDGLGAVLDAAVSDGANSFNGLQFGVAEPEPRLDEARALAVSDAMRKAKLLSEAAGLTLGSVQSITEAGGIDMPRPMMRLEAAMADGVPVVGGEVNLSAQVTMVFEIAE